MTAAYGRKKLLVLASKPPGRSPSQRFRLEQWAPRLARDHGIDLDFRPFESAKLSGMLSKPGKLLAKGALVSRDFVRRVGDIADARQYDVVVIHREAALIGPALFERALAWSGVRIIYDFDDAIWSTGQAWKNGIFSRLHFTGKTKSICRLATAITAGNDYLAAYARQYNDQAFVIPTSIELDDYAVVPEPAAQEPFVVCWTGSTSTLVHFEHARPALEELAQRLPLAVKVICNEPPARPIAGAEMRFVPWSEENEAREVGDCHAGIMPLPDNEVTKGKCGLKALQYMATGRPVVISPVGMNRDLIEQGVNGFLASTTRDYVDALVELAASSNLRARIGSNARRTIETSYSAEAIAPLFADVVRRVTEGD